MDQDPGGRSAGEECKNKAMKRRVLLLIVLLSMVGSVTAGQAFAAEKVVLKQADDRSVAVTTPVYKAAIDASGHLTELSVKGAKAFTMPFGGIMKPIKAESINVINNTVAIRNGGRRVEWTFNVDTIDVVTEGYDFHGRLHKSLKAIVGPGGKGGPFLKFAGVSSGLVLANDLTVTYNEHMHVHQDRILPSRYVNGRGTSGDLIEFTLKLGEPVEASQLLSRVELITFGITTHFPQYHDPRKITLKSTQTNLSKKVFDLTQRLTVLDHYVAGKEVVLKEQPVAMQPGQTVTTDWTLKPLKPGFYYAKLEVLDGERRLTSTKTTFTVDLDHYRPSLTRPKDFKAFWEEQVTKLRDLPFHEKLTEVPSKSTAAATWYDLELTIAAGKRYTTFLLVPRTMGQYVAAMVGKASKATKPDRVQIGLLIEAIEMMTFRRWNSREDNNMLDSYLLALRLTDYLRSRDDVKGIYLFGASRSGPVQFVNAALDPAKIIGVDIHVPTSAGIGWADKPYYAWGLPNGYDPTRPAQVKKLTSIAAYFDPVNFAPDMRAPWIVAYGLDDNLAHPQGIEAMYQLSPAKYKRISRDVGGHQYSKGFQKLQKELADHIGLNEAATTDEKILKEH